MNNLAFAVCVVQYDTTWLKGTKQLNALCSKPFTPFGYRGEENRLLSFNHLGFPHFGSYTELSLISLYMFLSVWDPTKHHPQGLLFDCEQLKYEQLKVHGFISPISFLVIASYSIKCNLKAFSFLFYMSPISFSKVKNQMVNCLSLLISVCGFQYAMILYLLQTQYSYHILNVFFHLITEFVMGSGVEEWAAFSLALVLVLAGRAHLLESWCPFMKLWSTFYIISMQLHEIQGSVFIRMYLTLHLFTLKEEFNLVRHFAFFLTFVNGQLWIWW